MAKAPSKSPFREQAVQYAAARRYDGTILRLSPAWLRWTYWLLVAAGAVALAFAVFGTVHEYAAGPAVVRVAGRADVTAAMAGTVRSIDVLPGQRVEAGATLVRFDAAPELGQMERLQREFDLQLARVLRDPADETARDALTALRTQRELLQARLDQLEVRAPRAGVVGDVRIRAGQRIEPGDVLVTLSDERAAFAVVAMLPGQYRPQLRPGARLRFEVSGYRYAYQDLVIESVGSQVIGPEEVRRYLGQEIGDTVTLQGGVVLVEARCTGGTFHVDDQSFALYHGMSGTAEVRIRAERIAVALVPGLRVLMEYLGG